jgi:hypothetical protein
MAKKSMPSVKVPKSIGTSLTTKKVSCTPVNTPTMRASSFNK